MVLAAQLCEYSVIIELYKWMNVLCEIDLNKAIKTAFFFWKHWGKFQHRVLDGIRESLILSGVVIVLWEGFYKSLSAVDGKCFSGTSVRYRFPTVHDVSLSPSPWGPPGNQT